MQTDILSSFVSRVIWRWEEDACHMSTLLLSGDWFQLSWQNEMSQQVHMLGWFTHTCAYVCEDTHGGCPFYTCSYIYRFSALTDSWPEGRHRPKRSSAVITHRLRLSLLHHSTVIDLCFKALGSCSRSHFHSQRGVTLLIKLACWQSLWKWQPPVSVFPSTDK